MCILFSIEICLVAFNASSVILLYTKKIRNGLKHEHEGKAEYETSWIGSSLSSVGS
jgi:hypothetical protein